MLDRVACEPPRISPQMFRTKIVHTSGIFFDFWGVEFFNFLVSKNIFNLCHHIEFNTQNPNPILKITISFTKTPKKPKHFQKQLYFLDFLENFKNPKFSKTQIVILHSLHVPQFIFFIFFFYFYVFIFLKKMENFKNTKIPKNHFFLFCIMYTFHNSYFYNFYIFL